MGGPKGEEGSSGEIKIKNNARKATPNPEKLHVGVAAQPASLQLQKNQKAKTWKPAGERHKRPKTPAGVAPPENSGPACERCLKLGGPRPQAPDVQLARQDFSAAGVQAPRLPARTSTEAPPQERPAPPPPVYKQGGGSPEWGGEERTRSPCGPLPPRAASATDTHPARCRPSRPVQPPPAPAPGFVALPPPPPRDPARAAAAAAATGTRPHNAPRRAPPPAHTAPRRAARGGRAGGKPRTWAPFSEAAEGCQAGRGGLRRDPPRRLSGAARGE